MKTFFAKWNKIPIILKLAVGLLIGILLGIFLPTWTWMGLFGTVFVTALKSVAPVLVFFLVAAALSKANAKIGSRFRTVIVLYIVTTVTAALVAVAASYIFPVTLTLSAGEIMDAPDNLGEVFKGLLVGMLKNPIGAIVEGNYLCILFWAVVFGLCLRFVAKDTTIQAISDVADAVTKVVWYVIQFAPFGVMGLVFDAVSQNGVSIFTEYGHLILVIVGSMLVASLVINPFIAWILMRKNPYPLLLTCLRESGITAFFTRSSAANIPMNMALCENLGLDRDFYSVSIPLGATINMDGAAITITVMAMAAANTVGLSINPFMALLLSLMAVLGACGASGVAGGSLLLIPMACSLFGIGNDVAMQVVAVGFIIGIVQDSVETALNSSGDAEFSAVAEYYDRRKRGEDMKYLGKYAKGKKADRAEKAEAEEN